MIQDTKSQDLPALCTKIRKRIIDVMSQNGGHLASNLGSIELTVALHHLFSSPTDKFLFDVSHQTYAHKILTGRDGKFETIRKYDGLCGFSNPNESEHDHFHMGHAATALPLALGMAKARDLAGRDEYIIPIIGDATLTCGLTFEALNNIPKDLKNFILILNDNKMSISKNVGAITDILSPELTPCSDFLSENERPVSAPTNSATFFGHYHLNYFGPFDGHNVEGIVKSLEAIKGIDGPVILHLKTVKGHGMEVAAENPTKYHGVKPFDPITGLFHKS
ncbi:MAG: 1-deoxy-D-xylulose-5-phosphate synthase N-terminal domain-containing protein, partial [Simkaniaceae bacterium]|nr:1-deoxy-D-xylulose-5-phosphate synthase N-terminal domain-containing protein [Simkaniaceae bacterium]